MRSNDTILLEKAYAKILREKEESAFRLNMYHDMAKAVGEDVYSLPRQNFNDAIDNLNLKKMSWYIHSREKGYEPNFLKIVGMEDGKIKIEDKQRGYIKKYIGEARHPAHGVKYEILNDVPKKGDYVFGTAIRRGDLLIGPIENEEAIKNIEEYIDKSEKSHRATSSYFKAHPEAQMD